VIGVILGIAFENSTRIKGSQKVVTTICTTAAIGLAVWQIGEHPKPAEPVERVVMAGGLRPAGTSPEVIAVHLQKWDFGRLAYGSKIAQRPAWATGWQCDQDGGCSFSDDAGVEYRVWDDEVVIKRFDLKNRDKHAVPFGIHYDEASQAIVKAFETETGLHMTCYTHKENANIPPGERNCSAPISKTSQDTTLDLHFGADGRLDKIEIFTQYV